MSITFQFRPDLHLILSTHNGDVPDAEFLQSYLDLFSDDNFDLSHDRLIDLRHADSSVRSPDALATLAAFVEERYRNTGLMPKTAVIAPEYVSFGLSRIYEVFSSLVPGEFVVFKSVDAALAWLQVPTDVLSDISV